MTTKLRVLLSVSLVASCSGLIAAQGNLGPAVRKARRAADATRLALEYRRISEALKPGDEEDLDKLARQGQEAIARLRGETFSLEAVSALDQLDAVYAGLPQKTWAADYARDLVAVVALTPGWAADEGGSVEEMSKRLADSLELPDAAPDAAGFIRLFPEDVPLEKFKHICPITIFLMKHRLKRPRTITKTTPDDIIADRLHVQVGAQVEGVVNWTTSGREFDRDYCFNIGNLHLEITPEWLLLHPKFIKPKVGDKVRVTGWTYWDYFHPAEHDVDEPQSQRFTDWEIHPVQTIERVK